MTDRNEPMPACPNPDGGYQRRTNYGGDLSSDVVIGDNGLEEAEMVPLGDALLEAPSSEIVLGEELDAGVDVFQLKVPLVLSSKDTQGNVCALKNTSEISGVLDGKLFTKDEIVLESVKLISGTRNIPYTTYLVAADPHTYEIFPHDIVVSKGFADKRDIDDTPDNQPTAFAPFYTALFEIPRTSNPGEAQQLQLKEPHAFCEAPPAALLTDLRAYVSALMQKQEAHANIQKRKETVLAEIIDLEDGRIKFPLGGEVMQIWNYKRKLRPRVYADCEGQTQELNADDAKELRSYISAAPVAKRTRHLNTASGLKFYLKRHDNRPLNDLSNLYLKKTPYVQEILELPVDANLLLEFSFYDTVDHTT